MNTVKNSWQTVNFIGKNEYDIYKFIEFSFELSNLSTVYKFGILKLL